MGGKPQKHRRQKNSKTPADQKTAVSENYRILTYSEFLSSEYFVHLSDFDCNDDDLNDFFKSDAAWYHEQNLAATHVVCSENDVWRV